jgi:hypothetical protein
MLEIPQSIKDKFANTFVIGNHNDCWSWAGYKDKLGYGIVRYGRSSRRYLAHRLSYAFTKGDIPSGLIVCHSCDNPSCVNPKHLWLGTHEDNRLDMLAKGRHSRAKATHCANGHSYAKHQYISQGARRCRICAVVNAQRYRERKASV